MAEGSGSSGVLGVVVGVLLVVCIAGGAWIMAGQPTLSNGPSVTIKVPDAK